MTNERHSEKPAEHLVAHGPRENTDDATKADAGLPGPPARSYSPVGMGDGEPASDEDADPRGQEPPPPLNDQVPEDPDAAGRVEPEED